MVTIRRGERLSGGGFYLFSLIFLKNMGRNRRFSPNCLLKALCLKKEKVSFRGKFLLTNEDSIGIIKV